MIKDTKELFIEIRQVKDELALLVDDSENKKAGLLNRLMVLLKELDKMNLDHTSAADEI